MSKITRTTTFFGIFFILCSFLSLNVFGQKEIVAEDTDMEVTEDIYGNNVYLAADRSIEANNIIANESDVIYTARNGIKLTEGFKVERHSRFKAYLLKKDVASSQSINSELKTLAGKTKLISVHPNVSDGLFYTNYENPTEEDLSILIYNSSGSIVYSKTALKPGKFEIDISNHPKGLYIIKAKTATESSSEVIVID